MAVSLNTSVFMPTSKARYCTGLETHDHRLITAPPTDHAG